MRLEGRVTQYATCGSSPNFRLYLVRARMYNMVERAGAAAANLEHSTVELRSKADFPFLFSAYGLCQLVLLKDF